MERLAQLIKDQSGIEWSPDTVYTWDMAEWLYDRLWDRHGIITDIIWHPNGYKVVPNDNTREFNHVNR